MYEEPIDAARLNKLIEELPHDGKRYLRMCIEGVVRCFMEDSTQIGVIIMGDTEGFGVNIMSMGMDEDEVHRVLTGVVLSREADQAAMRTPKEKLN